MGGIIGSLIIRPFLEFGSYKKHWGAVGTGVAGIIMQAFGQDAGLSPEQVQGFVAVVTLIFVNLLGNRA